jgi:hypothetical protein
MEGNGNRLGRTTFDPRRRSRPRVANYRDVVA